MIIVFLHGHITLNQHSYRKMKDISTLETSRRKRKQSDNSWLRKYKQLDVSILKNASKIEKNEDENNTFKTHNSNGKHYGFKKRKPGINLGMYYITVDATRI